MLEFWFALGIFLCVLEVILGFTVVIFFGGLGAFMVASLIYFGWMNEASVMNQFAQFFLWTTVWCALLFKPLKRMIKHTPDIPNIIGQEAVIINKDLNATEIGSVSWSGTIVKAKISDEAKQATLKVGQHVLITGIKENVFFVKEMEK